MQMTVIIALLKNSDKNYLLDYQRSITYFGTWCDDNFLQLNISKTKELLFGSYKTQIHPSIDINGEMVERECSILDTLVLHWMIISVWISIS